MTGLTELSAAETAAAVRGRRVSPTEVVRAHLERIERLDPRLQACITVCAEPALAAARALEREGQRDDGRALLGVPIGVKDQLWTKGVRTTAGSRLYEDFVPDEDATAVARVRAAGAIVIAKLNMSELALGGTERPPWGTPRNPWDAERTAGESSGGSGVAVAARLVSVSLAEDTGGSARGPAAYCGVVALRPTAGRVSRHGVMPLCPLLDTVAPMARTVADCALLLGAIAGHDPLDPGTSRRAVPAYRDALEGEVRGVRIGVVGELLESDLVDPEVRAAFDGALETLRGVGAIVSRVSIPLALLAGALFVAIADTAGAAEHAEELRTRAGLLDRATRTRLQAAALLPAAGRALALRARGLLREQFAAALATVDLLASPTSPFLAPTHASVSAPFRVAPEMRARFFARRSHTAAAALVGLPAISVPCGFSRSGLPIGLHLCGRAYAEADVLRAANASERATPWQTRRPRLD